MRAQSLLMISVAVIFLSTACSNDSASSGRDEADRNASSDRSPTRRTSGCGGTHVRKRRQMYRRRMRRSVRRPRRRDFHPGFNFANDGDALLFSLLGSRAAS